MDAYSWQVFTDPKILASMRERYEIIRADSYPKRVSLQVIEDAIGLIS